MPYPTNSKSSGRTFGARYTTIEYSAAIVSLQSHRLETLEGECGGQYAIRINEQWRSRFEWPETSSGTGEGGTRRCRFWSTHGAPRDLPRCAPGRRARRPEYKRDRTCPLDQGTHEPRD